MKDFSPPPPEENMGQNLDQTQNQSQPQALAPGLTFNWQDWLPYFEDTDIPEAQKRELIETLWQIMVAFVDLGFELNPHQQSCGQNLDLKALLEEAVLKSDAIEQARKVTNKPKLKEPTL